MYNRKFSTRVFTKEEDDLLNVLNRYGFMSFNQARYILSKFSTCHNDKQAQAVIYSLARRRCVEWVDEHRFVSSYERDRSDYIDYDIVKALGVILDVAKTYQDVQSAIIHSDVFRKLNFTTGGRLFAVSCLTDTDFLPNLFMNQQLFNEQMEQFNGKDELDNSDFEYTTIFVFSSHADKEKVLSTFDKATLKMPFEVWFLNEDDLADRLTFSKYHK